MKRVIPKLPLEERIFWASVHFTPEEVLEKLAKDRDEGVRKLVGTNPSTPPHVLEGLFERGECWPELALNPASPPELLERLWTADPEGVRYPLANNPNTPDHLLEEIAQRDPDGRWAVAKRWVEVRCAKRPEGLLRKLLEGAPSDWEKAMNPACPPELLRELAQKHDYAPLVAKNPSVPEEVLRFLARSEDPRIHQELAQNPSAPEDLLWALGEDKQYYVRLEVAGNPSCPEELLRHLGKDNHYAVRVSVARNPNCPPDLLEELVLDFSEEVRRAALTAPSLTLEGFLSLLLIRFERVGKLDRWEAYKLLPLLDRLPKEPPLWLAIWEGLDGRGRRIFNGHPEGRGMLLLGRLGR